MSWYDDQPVETPPADVQPESTPQAPPETGGES